MKHHYGYIRGTIGKDKDHVDVFMTNKAEDTTRPVYVIDQNTAAGKFDEHKVILGAETEEEARKTYLANYSKGWNGLGGITQMTQDEFKAWVRDPEKTKVPAVRSGGGLSYGPSRKAETEAGAAAQRALSEKAEVSTLPGRQAQGVPSAQLRVSKDGKGWRYSASWTTGTTAAGGPFGTEAFDSPDAARAAGIAAIESALPKNATGGEQAQVDRIRAWLDEQRGGTPLATPPAERSARAKQGTKKPKVESKTSPAPLFSLGVDKAPVFISALTTAIETAKGAPKRAKASVWREWLDGAQRRGEFRQEERDWMGLDEWLSGQPDVTREQLADFARANSVQVTETKLGDNPQKNTRELVRQAMSIYDAAHPNAESEYREYAESVAEEWANGDSSAAATAHAMNIPRDALRAIKTDGGTNAKFASYQLPGGENYRELLLTLPPSKRTTREQVEAELTAKYGREDWLRPGVASDEDRTRFNAAYRQQGADERRAGTYRSSHFDQPNILAHVRFNERTDVDGKRVLFLEEVQSDWHQAGRKKGYNVTIKPEDIRLVKEKHGFVGLENDWQWVAYSPSGERVHTSPAWWTEDQARVAAVRFTDSGVPDAPFKTTWPMLAMKRMVRYAADNGFDHIAWTTGEQQAARYDLSKQVDELLYKKNADGTFRLSATTGNRGNPFGDAIAADKLEDFVGKDVAQRIVDGEGKTKNLGGPGTTSQPRNDWTSLSGDGLKVGGEGMRGFYDNILPKEVNKFAKRFGAKAGQISVPQPGLDGFTIERMPSTGTWSVWGYDGIVSRHPTREAAQAEADRLGAEARANATPITVHSLDITPAMRAAALQGIPMFSQSATSAPARAETLPNTTVLDYDRIVQGITSRWRNGPKVDVVASFADLPAAVKAEAARYGSKGEKVKAVFHNGRVLLVADKLESTAEVQAAVFHEALGHFGLRMVFGTDMPRQVQRLANAIGGIGGIQRYAKANGINLSPYAAILRDPNRTREQQAAVLFDELFAHMAENRSKLAPSLRRKIGEFIGAIRNWLREHGFDVLAGRVRDGEIASLLSRAETALVGEAATRPPFYQGTRFSRAGSPPVRVAIATTALPAVDNGPDLRKAVRNAAREKFAEHVFTAEDGAEIIVPWSGIKKASEGTSRNGLAALLNIGELLAAARLVDSMPDSQGRRNILAIHTYAADAAIDGQPFEVAITVREHLDGRRFYDHEVVKQREPAGIPGEPDNGGQESHQPAAGPDDTIPPPPAPGNSDPETLFSMAAPAEILDDIEAVMTAGEDATVVERARARLKDWVPSKVKDQLRGTWLGALTTRHLTELGTDYFANIKHYSAFLAEMGADRNKLQAEGEDVVERARKWAGKHRSEAKALFNVMHDATIDGVDPAEEFKPLTFQYGGQIREATKKNVKEAIAAIREQMRGRSADNKTDMLNEAKVLRGMPARDKRRKAKYPSLVERWNALPAEAQKIYYEFRDMYADRSKQVEEALVARINDTDAPDNHKRKIINVIRQQFESQRLQGVYFPLQRKGRYFVAAEKADTPAFLMFEKLADLERAVKDLRARGFTIKAQGLKSAGKAQDAPSGTFVAEVIQTMQKAGVSDKTQDEIYQLYLEALPEMSMRKHAIHRQAVPGFDPDAVRAFAFNMHHGAHQLARLRYAHKLQNVLDVLKKAQDDKRREEGSDTRKIVAGDAVLDELARRHEWIMNPQDSNATNLVSSFGFAYYLGATPAAALVNLTQTALISFPYLAARFGPVKAMNQLLRGMGESIRTGGHIQRALKNQDELRAHQVLQSMGAIDKTQAHNLAGIAEGGMQGYNPVWSKAMEIIGIGFHKTEVVNREATGLAAFRMARSEGMSFAEAVQLAADTINDTHFDYCVDTETEALTTEGWKAFDQIKPGDVLFAVDANGRAVESRASEVNVFEGPRAVIEFSSTRRFSMALTPHHDALIQRHDSKRGWAPLTKVRADSLKNSHHVLRAPLHPITGRAGTYGEDFAALLGWIAAEGWYSKFRNCTAKNDVRLAQSVSHNPEHVNALRALLDRIGTTYSEQSPAANGTITWTIGGELRKRVLAAMPDKLLTFDMLRTMTALEMTALLDAFCKGDGSARGVGANTIGQADHNIQNLHVLQAMATLLGRNATMSTSGANNLILCSAGRKQTQRTIVKSLTRADRVVDTVWCPTTEHGTWIARRRGAVFVTGNSNANRARFMQSGTAKVLLMFRQYSLNMTWHLGRMVWNATKGESPEVKKLARRNLAGVLGMSALFSGAMGLPLMSVVMGMLNAIASTFGDDDDPWDAETEFRGFLNDMIGEGAAEVLLGGVANQVTGADIASRVSLSQLWFRDADRELDGRGAYYNLLEQAAGPMGGVLKNVLVGKQLVDEGHLWRGVETMLPKGLKDTMKAARYSTEGVNNLRGDPLIADPGVFQAVLQLGGFTPAQVARQYDVNRSLKNYEQAILKRRGSVMDAYAMAVRLGDQEAEREALAKIEAFNTANPDIPITRQGIKRSIRSRMQYSARAEAGIILNKKLAPRLLERVSGEAEAAI